MRGQGISLDQVTEVIRSSNRDVGGRVVEMAETEYMVRGRGYLRGADDIADLPLRAANGTPVRIRDIATVELGPDERARLTAARRAAAEKPEVLAASEQAKADRAQVRKLYLDYKSMREKAEASEAAHRKLQEAAMKEADPATPALIEKEKAAFRARMEKARKDGKAPEADEAEEG